MEEQCRHTFAFSIFGFDPRSGELTRIGHRLHIPRRLAILLSVLLENAGVVVTREELKSALWPEGEFLDFERAINNGISDLRAALQDNSKPPQFIETLPKVGYRFIEVVSRLELSPASASNIPLESADEPPGFSVELVSADGVALPVEGPVLVPINRTAAASLPSSSLGGKRQAFRLHTHKIWLLALCSLLLLISLAILMVLKSGTSQAPQSLSIGVAPFELRGEDTDQLSQSFRLELTDALSQLPRVQVRAAHSLTEKELNPETIGPTTARLGLDAILFGRLTLQGNRCVMQFELVRGKDALHLGSFQYDVARDQLASVRDRLQGDIFRSLNLTSDAEHPAHDSTAVPAAYEAYLRGRYYLTEQGDDSLRMATQEFAAAIAADQGFAKAYSGMALAYLYLAEHAVGPREENYQKAIEMASIAVRLNPSRAEGQAILGFVAYRHNWNAQRAERELRLAVDLEPNQALYHEWLAILLCDEGRFKESLDQLVVARKADPLWPPIYITEVFVRSNARDNVNAIATANKLLEMKPDWPFALDVLGNTLWYAGRPEEAIGIWRRMAALEQDIARIEIEDRGLKAFRLGGTVAYARVRLAAIGGSHAISRHPNDFVPEEWYAAAGDHDKAVVALEVSVDRHDPDVMQLAVSRAFDGLHQDPRFIALIARLGLSVPAHSEMISP